MDQFERFFKHVQVLAKPKMNSVEDFLHGAVGVSKESGELLDNAYRAWNYGKKIDQDNILEEAGDILFYLQICLFHVGRGLTLEDAINYNIEKLKKRYPEGYTDEAALARADKA